MGVRPRRTHPRHHWYNLPSQLQVVAWLMCGFGWLVPSISWSLIGWVLVYNIAWMFVLGGIRLLTERFAAYRTAQQTRSVHLVNQSLRLHAAL
jgi:H+-transporting ATPase